MQYGYCKKTTDIFHIIPPAMSLLLPPFFAADRKKNTLTYGLLEGTPSDMAALGHVRPQALPKVPRLAC